MYGNPYAYYFTYNHQKVFDISNFLSISSIDLQFYQDETFVDEFGDQIPITLPSGELGKVGYRNGVDNIFIDGVEVFLGLEADEIGKEKVICYTYDDVIYGKDPLSTVDRNKADKRTLQVAWVHQLDTDKYTVIDKDDKNGLSKYEGYHIYWYRQNWEEVNEQLQQAPDNLRGRNWEYLKGYDDQFTIDVVNNISRNKEQYCAIVWSSDTKEISNVLEFKNQIDIDNTNNLLKSDDALCFRIFKTANDGKELIQDDTLFNFYCYDELNKCTFTNDGGLWSNYWYYIQVYIKDPETLKYKPLRLDDNDNIVVNWKSPLDAEKTNIMANLYGGGTMFQDFAELTEAEDSAYLKDLNADTIVDANTFTRKFKIKPEYNFRYNNNLIIASFIRNGINYSLSRQFNFGNAASMGSKYSVEILMDNPLGYVVSGKDCQLHVVVRDEKGKDVTRENVSNISWTVYPNTYNHTEKDGGVILLTNTDKWNMHPPIIKCKVINVAPYPLEVVKGINLRSQDNQVGIKEGGIDGKFFPLTSIVPDRIEYRSDGSVPRYSTGDFILQLTNPDGGETTKEDFISNFYQSIKYDIEHFIYQDDNWTQDTLKDNFILSIIKSSSSKDLTAYAAEAAFKYTMPRYKLSLQNLNANNESEWTWDDDLRDKNIYYINTYSDDKILYSQSVAFDRNLYSSSLVNNWNSDELSIDEDNNSVLARMIGAGTKDTYNRFTGVLMGDFTDKSDGSIGTGITGFRNGSQSFGFKTDGTGFIGEAGAGQITFDGNRAKISSPDDNFYINLNPTRAFTTTINSNGRPFSSVTNYKSSDQFFLFARALKSSSERNMTSTTTNNSVWYKKFVNDSNYDYFVVDPINGMFLSGGVIASYGKLGNWTINSQGMYQKNEEAQKYMFLGYSPSASKDGEPDDTYAIFAGKNEYSDPVFSVSWDGHLKARSGIIGNKAQWHINDCGLTRKENQSIIHIGNGQAKDQDGKDLFTGTNDKNYNIFGAENDTINFGVTIGGYLFSRLGTIGGWNIDANRLYSTDNNIVFDSKDGSINIHYLGIDNNTQKKIYGFTIDSNGIVKIRANESQGVLWLADYSFIAYTPQNVSFSNDWSITKVSEDKPLNASFSYDSSNDWDDGHKEDKTITTTLTISTGSYTDSNTIALTQEVSSLRIRYNSDYGATLATGKTADGKKTVVFYPDGIESNFSSLGITGSTWNIYANNIFASAVNIDKGTLNANTLFMNHELVATEPWVYNMLNKVYEAISEAGDGVNDNADAIKGLSSKLAHQVVTEGTIESSLDSPIAKVIFKNKKHVELFSVKTVNATHAHKISCDGDGKVTVGTITGVGDGDATFNIADTSYFKQKMDEAKKAGWKAARDTFTLSGWTITGPGANYGSTTGYRVDYNASTHSHVTESDSYYSYIRTGKTVLYNGKRYNAYIQGEEQEFVRCKSHSYTSSSCSIVPLPTVD